MRNIYKRAFLIFALPLIAVLAFGCTRGTGSPELTPSGTGTVAQVTEETPTPAPQLSTGPAPAPEVSTPAPAPAPAASTTTTTTPATTATTTGPAPSTTVAPVAQSTPLTVLSIIGGEVLVKSAGTDSWHPATMGMTLQPGDTIKTGSGSGAQITFFEGTTLELQAFTEILVSEVGISDTGSTTISLKQQLGKTVSRVKKLTDTDSHYEIETPAAVAAVRGSQMLVSVTGSGRTEVANLEGDIRVIVGGVDYIVHEGMKRTIIPGQKPGPEETITPTMVGGGGGGGGSTAVRQSRMDVSTRAEPQAAHVGENITYTCWLHNVGDLPFHEISVNNDISGNATYQDGDANGDSVLDPGETWVYTSMYEVRPGDPASLVATFTVTATTSTFTSVVETETVTTSTLPDDTVPGIALQKTASASAVHAGDNITYTYTVTNTGNTPLSQVSVNDDRLDNIPFVSGDGNTDGSLDTDETWVFSADYTVSAEDPDPLENTANVSGTDAQSRTVTAGASASVAILKPGIALDKTANAAAAHAGDSITYTYTVTNTGNTPLSQVSVNDDRLGNIPFISGDGNIDGSLDTDETWVFSANYTVSAEDLDPMVNTANVSGTDTLSGTVTAGASASVAILKPGIALDKTANAAAAHAGDNITYTYTVTNTGNTPLSQVSVDDDRLGNVPFISGDGNTDGSLDTDETWVFSANYTVSPEDLDPLVNTANVSGTDALSCTVTAGASASVAILKPGIALDKTANRTSASKGDVIVYTYTVTNTGNTSLSQVLVNDDRLGNIPFIGGDGNANGLLDAGETWIFRASYKVTRDDPNPLVNTATVSAADDLSRVLTASDSASVKINRCP